MKRIAYMLAALTIAFAACSKETPTNNQEDKPEVTPSEGAYELFAHIDDLTKATISEEDGAFAWTAGNNGDEIAVKTNTGNVYKFKAVEIISDYARFICDEAIDGTPVSAVYPYTDDASCTLPSEISGLTGALSSSSIRLTGTISDGKNIVFSHANALLKVSFTNVPTFASKVRFVSTVGGYEQIVDVTGISLTSKGPVDAYIPVQSGNYEFSVYLIDTANNYLFGRTTTKAFIKGSLLRMSPVAVGYVVTIDPNGWDYKYLTLGHGGDYYSFRTYSEGGRYPYQLNELNGSYYVIPDSWAHGAWASEGNDVLISFRNAEDTYSSYTECVYLYRDITLTPQHNGVGGLKTNFRTYWNNSTKKYSQVKAYVWGSEIEPEGARTWSGIGASLLIDNLYYYEWNVNSYGNSIGIIFNDGNGHQTANHEYTLNREYMYEN